MLVLTRKVGESLVFSNGVQILIGEVKGQQVKIVIEAPKDIKVLRDELIKSRS